MFVLLLPSHWHCPEYSAMMGGGIIPWNWSWKASIICCLFFFFLFPGFISIIIIGIIAVLSKGNILIYSKSVVDSKKILLMSTSKLFALMEMWSVNKCSNYFAWVNCYNFFFPFGGETVRGTSLKDLWHKARHVDSPIDLVKTVSKRNRCK